MMTDLDLAKKQITWLAAHLRSRIVDAVSYTHLSCRRRG